MTRAAAACSSAVVTPGRTSLHSSRIVWATTRPAAFSAASSWGVSTDMPHTVRGWMQGVSTDVVDETELWDLETLAGASRLGDWMFEHFALLVRGRTVEVGAGIGTFSERMLAHGVADALLLEPEI